MTPPPTRPVSPGRRSRLLLWLPVVLYAVGIFVVSGSPNPPGLPGGVNDKTAHVVAYAGFSAVIVRALAGGAWSGVTGPVAIGAVVLATAYGMTDEIHQWFVPNRFTDALDLAADAAGASLVAAAAWAIARVRARRPGANI